jgi:hypothetical protein
MALEYELTLAPATSVEEIARRALPDPAERPTGTPPLLSAGLVERYGFGVTVLAGLEGYVEAATETGRWEWEPAAYVSLTFRMDKFADPSWEVTNMLTIVRRVLDSGTEDAALVLNGNELLLTRFDGESAKHGRHDWWQTYAGANDLIPD